MNMKSIQKALGILLIAIPLQINAKATSVGNYYVSTNTTEERLFPKPDAMITNKIYRGQKVEVMELKGDFARVSRYYDGESENVRGTVARWVNVNALSKQKPQELSQPVIEKKDPRIEENALPKVGEFGHTADDVRVLYKGANKYLNNGQCKKVELGSKSASKMNTYFLTCEGRNIFFTPSDLVN